MVGVYSHLSMRDLENHDLILHGLKPREEVLRPLVQIQRCTGCGAENAPVAVYCVKCGDLLPKARPEEDKTLRREIDELRLAVRMLQDASGLKANIPKQWVTTDQRQA